MKHITNKLRQHSGASMLLALVFMLFCVFIGGSLLASATANSARLKRTIAEDQEYLSLRSAALLLVADLRGERTELTISPETAELLEGEEDLEPEVFLTYTMTDNRNSIRELLYLCAACQYHNNPPAGLVYDNVDHPFSSDPDSLYIGMQYPGNDNLIYSDIELTLELDGHEEETKARMICDSSYNIYVGFLNSEGELSDKLHLEMASKNGEDSLEGTELQAAWYPPQIVKGGIF